MGGLVDRDVAIKNWGGVDFGISVDFGYILRIFRLGGKIKTFCATEPQFPKIPHRRHFKHQDCIQWLHLENYGKMFLFWGGILKFVYKMDLQGYKSLTQKYRIELPK